MRYDILPAAPADAPEILELQRLAYQSEAQLYNDWDIPPLRQTLPELEAELEAGFPRLAVLKAVDEAGAVIGSVRAGQEDGICRIGRLIVHPQRQRQGLGTALLAAVEARFPQAARYALFTGSRSEGNLRLYRRLGYHDVAAKVVSPALTLIFLEKAGPLQT